MLDIDELSRIEFPKDRISKNACGTLEAPSVVNNS
jgi:hypothetical protein